MQLDFEPIPSLNFLYEINKRGVVRDIKTRRVLKPYRRANTFYCSARIDKRNVYRSIPSLLHEVFGILPKNPPRQPVGVLARKDGLSFKFDSMYQATRFLAGKCFYSVDRMAHLLCERRAEISGWHITYREPFDIYQVNKK